MCLKDPPYRPIQYLGSKLRALSAILSASDDLIGSNGHVADLFTGTTVVAQGYAKKGYKVSAVDTQLYASFFGQALLGIGRDKGESCDFMTLSQTGLTATIDHLRVPWQKYIEIEKRACRQEDVALLKSIQEQLPLIWKQENHPLREYVKTSSNRLAFSETPLITQVYSGLYFGVSQAVVIDELRQNAESVWKSGRISKWQYSAALTAIMAAASAAVHSAGKHFAQPLNQGTLKNESFLDVRLVKDRNIDILTEFKTACNEINLRACETDVGNVVWHGPAEDFVSDRSSVDLYYLDPPYTAQQYSRFYHILETISTYEYPQLYKDDKLTAGLYPSKRYKSAFSSKRKSPNAFRSIITSARNSGTALLISYSRSAASSKGNERMITLKNLLRLCESEYGRKNVDWYGLRHRYRQFNSTTSALAQRDDSEMLIRCKPP